MVLRLHGYAVEVAFNGPDALSLAATFQPEAAILTLALPGLDGYEVARRLRNGNGKQPRPILIALTGYGRDEDRARTRDAGFDYHLLKPADPLELLELIRTARSTPT
jgi:CheY-like chemotaxis protein